MPYLDLSYNIWLRGDVAVLASATQLRYLNLISCPQVTGEVEALATLIHLGEPQQGFIQPPSGLSIGSRGKARTGVHGPVAALRALPGLGADWEAFSKCSEYDTAPDLQVTDTISTTRGCDEPQCAGLAYIEIVHSIPSLRWGMCFGSVQGNPVTEDMLSAFEQDDEIASAEICPGEFVGCGASGLIANAAEVAGSSAEVCCAVLTCVDFDCTGARFDLATDAGEVVCAGERCSAEECESLIGQKIGSPNAHKLFLTLSGCTTIRPTCANVDAAGRFV